VGGEIKVEWVRNREQQLGVEFKAGLTEKWRVMIKVVKQY